jgi:hypothetical protein
MPPRKKAKSKDSAAASRKGCVCGHSCHEDDAHLPGLLLLGLGLVALPINLGLVSGMEWALAWPLLIVFVGIVLALRVNICRMSS